MEGMVLQAEATTNGVRCDYPEETNEGKLRLHDQIGSIEGNSREERKELVAPAVGMEFESYDDVYNYYSYYARETGFSVRVKNSWFKRNSRDKYGAVLCCSSQGFKRVKDVNRTRRETRTGCPAMMRMRLMDSRRWRIVEATLEHNHVLGLEGYRPVKNMSSGTKKKLMSDSGPEPQPVKLYRTVVIDAGGYGTSRSNQSQVETPSDLADKLDLRKGDSQAMYNYLCRMQLTNPNFFYLMDLNDEGRLGNVFWADARSRAGSCYFSDVIFLDNACLLNNYEIPLVEIVGINHHAESILLGCGLLASETIHSYKWLLKAWVSCTSGHIPQTIITDRCKILQSAVAEVFPKSHHRFSLFHIMRKVPEKLGGLHNYGAIKKALQKSVFEALKPFDFESAWGFMIQNLGVAENEWLRSLYEERALWSPVYQKDIFFMGMATARPGETMNSVFEKYLHKQTPLKEFLDKYELGVHKKHKEEAIADMDSRNSIPELKTQCAFELQLSKIYTTAIFKRFQLEVEQMNSCFSTTPVQIDGGTFTVFLVKERVLQEGNRREVRHFEVLFSCASAEVRCICSCFNFYGYLCRHALSVLNFNGVNEVPPKYILPRWKKDYKRLHIQYGSADDADTRQHMQWFNQLFRSTLQVVEEGGISLDHYKVALNALEESLERVHRIEEKHGLR